METQESTPCARCHEHPAQQPPETACFLRSDICGFCQLHDLAQISALGPVGELGVFLAQVRSDIDRMVKGYIMERTFPVTTIGIRRFLQDEFGVREADDETIEGWRTYFRGMRVQVFPQDHDQAPNDD